MQIVLLGYMGSGKTTIGKILADKLNVKCLDLDQYIEGAEGKDISSLFKEKGEIYFRKKEAESLREVLSTKDDFVLSIGGGTPCYANNMSAIFDMTENGIYLKVGLDELVKRLSKEKTKRPLIASIPEVELHEFIGKHLFERSFYYNQASHVVNCDDKSIQEIVIEIESLLS
ncbi:shikimate kinase [Maribacter algarum]|uniref:Shikimate kinase n=1 Tax=Maribacter algarum (ex Zhang et al. 2020) TaxID=2578118 RepID=A0A5S3PH53_9FLAO|nr:shikimate kinase [Maribacter algarum]TMM53445.1 shikimate kinase [Maribacter algarum]